ncbi:hypothetical protein KP509_28G044100 [Ceratopteris richardii]|uniref:Uncharacterized protein n=1 Tax=Ceratopteris richardii TaxID=49495 RepID=A0A8T2RCW7_CERRI|nr:hypothetical protein KP509_28G044100 [Ceratopteris richardii]
MCTEEPFNAPFHVVHKVPAGDGLYVRAKHAQLVEKNPERAIALFRASLEAGDRVDSALKDLAVVLKQQNRPEDAIAAISTFRGRCSESARDSLDNVLLDLYKSCGRLEDQIALLIQKLKSFQNNQTFNGKRTKTARSQGKKFQVSVEQEVARLLGNLGWAYMQQSNYYEAESVYRRALKLDVDSNKVCNLGLCLIKQGRPEEAIAVLREVFSVSHRRINSSNKRVNSDSYFKSCERAQELIEQASAMLKPAGLLSSTDSTGSNYISVATLWDRYANLQSRLDKTYVSDCFNGCSGIEGSSRLFSHVDDTSVYEDDTHCTTEAEKLNNRVAAGWVLACRDNHHDDDFGSDDGSFSDQESLAYQTRITDEGFQSLLDASSSTVLPSIPSWDRQNLHGYPKRLPVFRDITLLGSAAA